MTRFLDSYAIIAWLSGHPSHRDLDRSHAWTHEMNILEALVYMIRRRVETPRGAIDALGLSVARSTDEDLMVAATIKANPGLRSRNLSYVDALGYSVALRMGLPFRTGDSGFMGLPGVEFVK